MRLTKLELEEEIRTFRGKPRAELPRKYRDPQCEKDMQIGIGIYFADNSKVIPIYDENDCLTGWKGIALR